MTESSMAIAEVVGQDGQDRNALAHGGLEVHTGEADGSIAQKLMHSLSGVRAGSDESFQMIGSKTTKLEVTNLVLHVGVFQHLMHLHKTSQDLTDRSRLLVAVGDASMGTSLASHLDEPMVMCNEDATGLRRKGQHIGIRPRT